MEKNNLKPLTGSLFTVRVKQDGSAEPLYQNKSMSKWMMWNLVKYSIWNINIDMGLWKELNQKTRFHNMKKPEDIIFF